MSTEIVPVDVTPDQAECRFSDSGMHCDHWWEGKACCACKDPAMTPTPVRRRPTPDEEES